MQNIYILSAVIAVGVINVVMMILMATFGARVRTIARRQTLQYNIIVKMQALLKNRSATNAVAENAELIYQDLLQNLIPIMAAIDIMPRNTSEHPLWRALGGIMDEYAKNPFVMEKLRRCIKLDAEVARSVENYLNRADGFLRHITAAETDGILTATFTDGLLGQSITFFTQAKNLAMAEK